MDFANRTSECMCFDTHSAYQGQMQTHKLKRFLAIIQNLKVGDILTGTYHGKETVAYCYKADMGQRGPRYYFKYIIGKSPCGRSDEFSYQIEIASMLNCGLKVQHKGIVR